MKYLLIFLPTILSTVFTGSINEKTTFQPTPIPSKLKITIGTSTFEATLYDNETTKVFKTLLPLSIQMSELNGNEKYYYLDSHLPSKQTQVGKIQAGDIMLYGDNCLVVFYKTFITSYTYTPLGRIDNITGLSAVVGAGKAAITFELK